MTKLDKIGFWKSLLWLMVLALGGVIVAVLIMKCGQSVSSLALGGLMDEVVVLHITQWAQTLCVMILAPVLWVRYVAHLPLSSTLRLQWPGWRPMAVVLVGMLLLSPALSWLEEWIHQWPWPEVLRQWADDDAATQEHILRVLLRPAGVGGWIELVLLMSVATAMGEELLFRGALLRCFERTSLGRHFVAVLIGAIFAYIHFDLYGLIPRWLMGTLFVELVYWSGSLWPAVLAHAINNLLALLEYKDVL